VAWSTVGAALAGGAIVALVGAALAWRLALAQEDHRLRDAVHTLADEIDELGPVEGAVHEQRELSPLGIDVGVFEGARRLGGGIAAPSSGDGCATLSEGPWRRCRGTRGALRLETQASLAPLYAHTRASATGTFVAWLVALAAAWLASARAASLAIAPLRRLEGAVQSIDASAPDPRVVAQPLDCDEVDRVRTGFFDVLTRLAATLAQSRRFAADAAHEMRTPLASLRAELELAHEVAPDDATRDALGRARKHVEALSRRLDRVLVLAVPDRGARGEPVSLDTAAREAIAALAPAQRARVTLTTDAEGLTRGDEALVAMAVENAVDNALKFSEGPVRVAVFEAPDAVSIEVSDEGVGVPEGERERVFEPFHRLPGARASTEGMGLGLALIAHVARLYGGSARFAPVARGAVLRITLPRLVEIAPLDA
jgi:signal transduction histidine kinase